MRIDLVGAAAVLLDLDGTLIDTEPVWMAAELRLAATHGARWTEQDAISCIGNPIPVSAQRLQDAGVGLPVDEIAERLLGEVVAAVRNEIPWQPGAERLLKSLHGRVPLALVTMSYRSLADAVLDALPVGTFSAVVTGDQVTYGKPHPEPYLRACQALGVRPQDCVVIEDSPAGIGSGLAAGAQVVAVPRVAPLPPDAPVTVVPTLEVLVA